MRRDVHPRPACGGGRTGQPRAGDGVMRWAVAFGLALFACTAQPQPVSAQTTWRTLPASGENQAAALQWDVAAIVGRCDAGVLTVFIAQGGRLAEPSAFVMMERRGDPPTGQYWRVSTDGRSAFAFSPAAILRTLRKGGTLDLVIKSREAPDWETTLTLPTDASAVDAVLTACGEQPPDAASVTGSIVWARPPRPLANDFPSEALRDVRSGQASVQCHALADGRVDCIVADEAPSGLRFGDHAVAIVERGAIRLSDGATGPLEGRTFTVRVPFSIDDRRMPRLEFSERIEAEAKPLITPEVPIR